MDTLKFVTVLFWAFFTSSISYGQAKSEKIKSIQQVFQKTNSDTTLQLVILENEDFLGQMTDGGGSLNGHFKNNSLHKITAWVGLSFGNRQTEYYFSKGKLIFVYATEKHFKYNDTLQQVDHTRLDLVAEGRYYFYKNKLIDKKTKGTRSWDDANALEQLFIKEANKYSKLLRSKRNER